MGCVYYRWQLVFADIINNKLKSHIEIVDWTWYTDDCKHLIIPTNWLYTWHPIGHLILYWLALLFSIHISYVTSVLFHHMCFLVCSHLYSHVFPFFSYTFTRSSDSLDLHIQIQGYLLLIRYLERIIFTLRSWLESLPFDYRYPYSFIHISHPVTFLILIHLLSLC